MYGDIILSVQFLCHYTHENKEIVTISYFLFERGQQPMALCPVHNTPLAPSCKKKECFSRLIQERKVHVQSK